MKLKQVTSTLAVIALSAATVVGHSGTARASELSYTYLCINVPNLGYQCAQGGGGVVYLNGPWSGGTGWYWPDTNHWGQIIDADSGLCMQLDKDAGYAIIEATCGQYSWQYWYLTSSGQFISDYDRSRCLTYNASQGDVDAVGCDGRWYQHWYGPSS